MTSLAYRSPTVPLKRKSLDVSTSENLSDSSSDVPHKYPRRERLSHAHPRPGSAMPSSPSDLEPILSQVSVVIPPLSPSQKRSLAIASRTSNINGMDSVIFPTTDQEDRVTRAAYPITRPIVNRRSIPLSFNSPESSNSSLSMAKSGDHLLKLRRTLDGKLNRIDGPQVTTAVDSQRHLAKLADNFEFVNGYQYRAGVERIPDDSEFNYGCACKETTGCKASECDCLSKEEDSEDRIIPYQISETNSKLIVATERFLKRKAIIYECNSRCGCTSERCWNHVVQNGRTVRLEIFDTGARGFGMPCL